MAWIGITTSALRKRGPGAAWRGMALAAGLVVGVMTPPTTRASGSPLVRVWQSEDGLPGNVVRSMVQTSDGYLWVANAEGIARFDGLAFEPVEPDGELRRLRFAFSRLFALPDNSLWAATYQGALFRVRDSRLEMVVAGSPIPRAPWITQVVPDHDGAIHFLRGGEIWKLGEGGPQPVAHPAPDLTRRFAEDLDARVQGGRAVVPETTPILERRDGSRWSVAPHGQLIVTDATGAESPLDLPGLDPPFFCNEFLEDREGNAWIATAVNGLVRIRNPRVDTLSTADGLLERQVFGLMQHSDGVWWIANRRGGIDLWTPEAVAHLELVPTGYQRAAAAMFEDRWRRVWVGSRGGSVFLHRDGVFEPQFHRSQTPSKVRTIQQDADGRMWFGGEQGLASFDGSEVRSHGGGDGLPACDVTTLMAEPGGTMLVGTSDGRVFRGGTDGFSRLGDPSPLRHWWISGILAKSHAEIWVTTIGGGLFLWDGNSWHRFANADGLPDSRLTTILDDGRGHFWFGSLGGILRTTRTELLARVRHRDQPLHWLRLDRSDGLPTRECIGGYQPAGWMADDGHLWFPTGSGVVRVRPDLVEVNRVPPPVFLRSTRINGRESNAADGSIEAGPGRSRVEFAFAGLSYAAPEKVTYRARLGGLDDRWRELGAQRTASYEAVPPGRYTFEVVAINGDGVSSDRPARVAIHIRPHYWESPQFIAAAGLLTIAGAIGVGWAIARARLKRRIVTLKLRHARETERSRIARDLHDDLGASLTEISILSALAAEGSADPGMRPALEQLSGKAKTVVDTLDEIVWAVNPGEDSLRSLVDYLAACAREFLGNAGITLRTEIPRHLPDLPLESSVRHGVFLAAREALNNLVKHSHASEARLTVAVTTDRLEIRIQDNGHGFDQAQQARHAKGYGVGNLAERMRACHGDCTITSIPGEGVVVALSLPLAAPKAH